MWQHIGKPFATADISAVPSMYQPFKVTTGYRNQLLRSIVAGVMFYNTPAFADVKLEIWSDNGGVPGRLITQSLNAWTQAECNTNIFAYRLLGFTFPPIAIRKNTFYHLAVRPSGYTGDASSHIAWRQSWPDPQYTTGITLTLEFGAKFPYEASFVTDDL